MVRFAIFIFLALVRTTGLLAAMRVARVFYFGAVALHGSDIAKWATIYALVFTLVALREEFRARGYALFTLSAGIGFWPAAVLSAAYFGYSHHGNSGEDWIGLVNAGLFGLLACFLLRRTGNLDADWSSHGPSIGARRTFTVCPTAAVSYQGIFRTRCRPVPRGSPAAPWAPREDSCFVVDLRNVAARGQISEARPGPATKCTRST
jgi:hypothetical protein